MTIINLKQSIMIVVMLFLITPIYALNPIHVKVTKPSNVTANVTLIITNSTWNKIEKSQIVPKAFKIKHLTYYVKGEVIQFETKTNCEKCLVEPSFYRNPQYFMGAGGGGALIDYPYYEEAKPQKEMVEMDFCLELLTKVHFQLQKAERNLLFVIIMLSILLIINIIQIVRWKKK